MIVLFSTLLFGGYGLYVGGDAVEFDEVSYFFGVFFFGVTISKPYSSVMVVEVSIS